MAPRWIKSKDHEPSQYDPDDLLLLSGKFVVGRVYRDRTGPHASRFFWLLTGFVDPGAPSRGMTDSEEGAKAELLASWQRWQACAGMRDAE